MEWEPFGNQVLLQGDRYYISYRADTATTGGRREWSGDYGGCDETALVNEATGRFYILNGDFRTDYEEAFLLGWDACYRVYLSLEDRHVSSWSMTDDKFGPPVEMFEDDCDDDELL